MIAFLQTISEFNHPGLSSRLGGESKDLLQNYVGSEKRIRSMVNHEFQGVRCHALNMLHHSLQINLFQLSFAIGAFNPYGIGRLKSLNGFRIKCALMERNAIDHGLVGIPFGLGLRQA